MDVNKLCMGCMQEKNEIYGACPYCGYDNQNDKNKDGQLPVYTLLNNTYSIGKCLGAGGFGITYIAFDCNLQKRVAIKEFYPDSLAWRGEDGASVYTYQDKRGEIFVRERDRFISEARALAKLDEQNGVVKVIHYFQENNTAYIVMEFLSGKSLKTYMAEKGGKISVEEALKLLEPVIKTLAGIHKKGLVHSDISLDNIMLTTNGMVKLIDFGAVRDIKDINSGTNAYKKTYSPPEQSGYAGDMGTYSDIYALCVTFYRMITGRGIPSAKERMEGAVVCPPSVLEVDISPEIEAALMQGLELDIDKRIKNASDLYYFFIVCGRMDGAHENDNNLKGRVPDSMVDKMRREEGAYRRKRRFFAMGICIFILGCLIISVRQIARVMQNKSDDTDITTESTTSEETGKTDDAYTLTDTDREKYINSLISDINADRQDNGQEDLIIDDKYRAVADECGKSIEEAPYIGNDDWTDNVTTCVTDAMSNSQITDAGWLVLPYTNIPTEGQVKSDACIQIERINANVQNPINLTNCDKIGVAVSQSLDGTIYYIIIYR